MHISGKVNCFKTLESALQSEYKTHGQAGQSVVLGIIPRAFGTDGLSGTEIESWILRLVNILDVLRSAFFWLNHGQIWAYWGTWEPSSGRTWLHKPSSSPASTKQSDESQALWHTEAADGDSCSRREMWPCSVLTAIWRHRNQIQLACVKTPPPFCMVWSCKLHLFSKGKMY